MQQFGTIGGSQADEATDGDGRLAWVDNETSSLGRAWYPVALSTEVTEAPFAVELLGKPWVLARLGGELVAFADACPHRLMPLSAATVCGQTLRCSYHGWQFDVTGAAVVIPSIEPGTPITGRARASAPAGLVERYGAVWMAPDDPVSGLPDFPEWDDDSFEVRVDTPSRTTASAAQVMDNSCDVSHFVVVHAGTFGGDATALSSPRSIERDGWKIRATYETHYRVLDEPRIERGELPELQLSRQTKTFHLGSTLELRMEFPDLGSTFTILASSQPERSGSTRVYRWFARNDIVGDETRWAECLKVEEAVMAEDLSALNRYRDYRLPLDLRTEVHVPADRLSLAYRRLLDDLTHAGGAAAPAEMSA
jgi:phenylpropionate dioxygenase-like ring-hydroxylating dioxygenase large terminal subunit